MDTTKMCLFSLAYLACLCFVFANKNVHDMEMERMGDANMIKMIEKSIFGPKLKVPGNEDFAWGNCRANDPVTVKSMALNAPIKNEKPIIVSVTVLVGEKLDNLQGKLSVQMSDGSGGWQDVCGYLSGACDIGNVCERMEKIKTCPKVLTDIKLNCKCPIEANTYPITNYTHELPIQIPITGEFNVTLSLTMNGKNMACAWVMFKIE